MKKIHPESAMMTHGYDPASARGSIKTPIYQTSTFVFETAEDGKAFFEISQGKRAPNADGQNGLIYSRLNNPNLEIVEARLCLWDGAEAAAVFESGIGAISTVMMEFLKPGDLVIHTAPLYGGTDLLLHHIFPKWGIKSIAVKPGMSLEQMIDTVEQSGMAAQVAMVYIETPSNPTTDIFDLEQLAALAHHFSSVDKQVISCADNTYMGPLWQQPIAHGIDIVMYSATKYIGGHSDVIAGAVLGKSAHIARIKKLRTALGNMAGPHTAWLLARSLETLKVRMDRQQTTAQIVAEFLSNHPVVEEVRYLGLLPKGSADRAIFEKQCSSPGAMLAFEVNGGEPEAFAFLNNLELIKLAVSLGSTESLAEHPRTMTHSNVDPAHLEEMKIGHNLIRLSIGLEHPDDLIRDLSQALKAVKTGGVVAVQEP